MTTTIDMAREVYGAHTEWNDSQLERLEQLVAIVRADEREACAKVCDEYDDEYDVHTKQTIEGIAMQIRARGDI